MSEALAMKGQMSHEDRDILIRGLRWVGIKSKIHGVTLQQLRSQYKDTEAVFGTMMVYPQHVQIHYVSKPINQEVSLLMKQPMPFIAQQTFEHMVRSGLVVAVFHQMKDKPFEIPAAVSGNEVEGASNG